MARIGLLGGSFNPAHGVHRHISLVALQQLRLNEVWWLVSPLNPLKSEAGMAPLATRVARAKAIARHPRIKVTALEEQLGTRFAVDTVAALQRRFPQHQFIWLAGSDIVAELHRWRRWRHFRRAAPRHFAAWRPGAELVRLVASHAFTLDAGRSAGDNQLALPFAAGIGYRDPQRRSRLGHRRPI